MGGWGSGRRWNSKEVTTDYRRWDIRKTAREGWLAPGSCFISRWFIRGEEQSSVQARAESDRIVVSYRHQYRGEQWESLEYPIFLDRTLCHYGGSRPWFVCPGRGCGRRVAVLYSGRLFLCRHCRQLVYESQRESDLDRVAGRLQSLSSRLIGNSRMGDIWTIFDGCPPRPKGMHKRTYERLARRFEGTELRMNLETTARFGAVN